jgi:hypothetical protein
MAAEMLRVTAGKSPDVPCANADAMHLSFADGAFGHVIAVTSLRLVTDQGRARHDMAHVGQALEARLPSLPFGGFLAVIGTPHSGGAQNRRGNRSQ